MWSCVCVGRGVRGEQSNEWRVAEMKYDEWGGGSCAIWRKLCCWRGIKFGMVGVNVLN